MNATSLDVRAFRDMLEHPRGGLVGMVDDVLKWCHDLGLQLEWQVDRCRVHSTRFGWEETVEAPLRVSVFRAMLARVAALCNERSPRSVSPYGGQGTLAIGTTPGALFQVSFANTQDEHWLTLSPVQVDQERPV